MADFSDISGQVFLNPDGERLVLLRDGWQVGSALEFSKLVQHDQDFFDYPDLEKLSLDELDQQYPCFFFFPRIFVWGSCFSVVHSSFFLDFFGVIWFFIFLVKYPDVSTGFQMSCTMLR